MKEYIFTYKFNNNITLDFFIDRGNKNLIISVLYENSDEDELSNVCIFEKTFSLQEIFEKLRENENQLFLDIL